MEKEMEKDIKETLQERGSTYGDYRNVADITQQLYITLVPHFADRDLDEGYSNVQLSSLQMICSKLARIACGDPDHIDSWHDIAGYATLVVDDIARGNAPWKDVT